MRIAIVEDDQQLRLNLKSLIQDTCKKSNLSCQIDLYSDGQDFINAFHDNYDCVYLDIEMPQLNGMETAQILREKGSDIIIVFVTNHVQYAIEGYSVNATDFLLKPLNAFYFEKHFKKIVSKLKHAATSLTITLKYKNQVDKINASDILYIESHGHYLYYHLPNHTYTVINSLKDAEANLQGLPFFRCHNYYLVNLDAVISIVQDTVKIGSRTLQISRPRKKAFLNALMNHLGGKKI